MVPDHVQLAQPVPYSPFGPKGFNPTVQPLFSTVYIGDGSLPYWFYPMPHSVLDQIATLTSAYKVALDQVLDAVTISPAEYAVLKQELGTKGAGSVTMINGVDVKVGPVSDLPPVIPVAADLPSVVETLKKKGTGPPDLTYEGDGLSYQYIKIPGSDEVSLLAPPPPYKYIKIKDPEPDPDSGSEHYLLKKLKQKMDIEAQSPIDVEALAALKPTLIPSYLSGAGEWTGFDKGTDEYLPLLKAATPPKVYHQSGSDEHGTPQDLFDTLDKEFKFTLDVCATDPHEVPVQGTADGGEGGPEWELHPGNAKCPIYFTKDDNGLGLDWFGTVWMNPPYTKGQVKVWITKLIKEMLAGHITRGVALVAARPDTQWFQTAVSYAAEVRFLKGRLTFQGSTDPAPFPSAVLVFNPTLVSPQIIKFWDWRKKVAVSYYGGGTGPEKGKGGLKPVPVVAGLKAKLGKALYPNWPFGSKGLGPLGTALIKKIEVPSGY